MTTAKRIPELNLLTAPAADDQFVIYDTSAGETKRIPFADVGGGGSSLILYEDRIVNPGIIESYDLTPDWGQNKTLFFGVHTPGLYGDSNVFSDGAAFIYYPESPSNIAIGENALAKFRDAEKNSTPYLLYDAELGDYVPTSDPDWYGEDARVRNNIAIGYLSLGTLTYGQNNVAVGYRALGMNNQSDNTAIGHKSLWALTEGSRNVAIGALTGIGWSTTHNNVSIGYAAGSYQSNSTTELTTTQYSVYIGSSARGSNTDNNTVVIGGNTPISKGANTTVIGTSATTEFWAFGTYRLDANNIQTDTTTGTKIGTSTSQKLGFWDKAPIVQPTTSVTAGAFVANTGTAVNSASTFDGYTIGKVVTALRNMGLLA